MSQNKRSIAEICSYDVWLGIFRYSSLSANLGLDEVLGSESHTWPISPSTYSIVPAVTRELMRNKCTLRLVSKEFNHLASSVFYEALLLRQWSRVTDLLALVDSNPHVKETLSRSTKRIDLPYDHADDDLVNHAALLLNACPNVTHLTCAFLLSTGNEFLEQMRTMGFGSRLQYLHLTGCHVDIVTPYLHCFSNLEIVRISRVVLVKDRSPRILPASVHLPRLKSFYVPDDISWEMKNRILDAPILPIDGGHQTFVSVNDLWKEYGYSLEELPPGAAFRFNMLRRCPNLRVVYVPRGKIFDFDKNDSPFTTKVKNLVITLDHSWEEGYNKQGKMVSLFKTLLSLIEQGIFPSLKEFTVDAPKFRRRAWDVFPWASRVWHRRLSACGVQLFDKDGPLDYPTNDIYY